MNIKPWRKFKEPEYDDIWNLFYRAFDFNPSIKPSLNNPTFKEPTPSITFSFQYDIESDILDEFHELMLGFMKSCAKTDEEVLLLDWQHEGYAYAPHLYDPKIHPSINFFPDGDYAIALSRDWDWGILGHPWEQSICFFGSNLIELVVLNLPKLFDKMIRQNGVPIEGI